MGKFDFELASQGIPAVNAAMTTDHDSNGLTETRNDALTSTPAEPPARPKLHRRRRITDGTAHLTPTQLAARWGWHPESIRRAIRQRRIRAIIISRCLLVPREEVERMENEGRIG